MANNTYTQNFSDGAVLTTAQLDAAFTSLKPALAQTTLLTTGAGTNTVLTATTPGGAATWTAVPNDKITGPQNYGLKAVSSSNALVISLTGNGGSTPSTSAAPVITFGNYASSTGTVTSEQFSITSARTITVNASATLGLTSGSNLVYVYALRTSSSASGVRLAVSGFPINGWGRQSTTAISASADASTTLYATAAFSTVPFAYLGSVQATLNSSFQWSAVTETRLADKFVDVNRGLLSSTSPLTFSTTSSSYVSTGLSVTVKPRGKPILVALSPRTNTSSTALVSRISIRGTATGTIGIAATLNLTSDAVGTPSKASWQFEINKMNIQSASDDAMTWPPGSVFCILVAGEAAQTLTLKAKVTGTTKIVLTNVGLIAYEIG